MLLFDKKLRMVHSKTDRQKLYSASIYFPTTILVYVYQFLLKEY